MGKIAPLCSYQERNSKVFYLTSIETLFCCFLGGGDISFINGKNSAVSEEGPPSPKHSWWLHRDKSGRTIEGQDFGSAGF